MPCVFLFLRPVSGARFRRPFQAPVSGVTRRFCSGLELQRQRLARSFSYSACLSASALQHS